jgi:[ribosomal protein S5]-alanine N-acetyltransferase
MINELNVVLNTERLLLERLNTNHHTLILELLNTHGWIKFIGDRNVHSIEEANNYIDKINKNTNIAYWAVTLKETNQPIGLVTLIKRDYLQHPDIGFAFLPQYIGNGYAFEAANTLINFLTNEAGINTIDACTLPDNVSSIKLLEKLGLQFTEQITHENDLLSIYRYTKV